MRYIHRDQFDIFRTKRDSHRRRISGEAALTDTMGRLKVAATEVDVVSGSEPGIRFHLLVDQAVVVGKEEEEEMVSS